MMTDNRKLRGSGKWLASAAMVSAAFVLIASLHPARVGGQSGNAAAIVSAASYQSLIAPDSIAAIFGGRLATSTVAADRLPLPTSLGGTTVTIGGRPAPLFFVAPGQVNCLVPPDLQPGQHALVVRSGDGAVSNGEAQVGPIAPAIITADASGRGLPAAQLLRLRDGNALPIENVTAAPINLGAENEHVFLLLYLTGLRRETNNVRVRVGNSDLPSFGPATAVAGFAGLDQVNVEIPRTLIGRGKINVAVMAAGLVLSNEVQLDIGGLTGVAGAPVVTGYETAEVSAGDAMAVLGSNFNTDRTRNIVRIAGTEASVLEAAGGRLRVRVPYGAVSGPVSVINERGEEGRGNIDLRIKTSLSGFVESTRQQPIRDVSVKIRNTPYQTRTDAEGLFSFRDLPNLGISVDVEIDPTPANQSGTLPFPKILLKKRFLTGRDNFLERIPLQQDSTLSVQVGATSAANDAAAAPDQSGFARQISTGGIIFEVQSDTPAQFPDGATRGRLTMTLVADNRTPVSLPPSEFVSGVVQLTPFDATLTRGGKLSFPNPEGLAPGTPAKLYRFVSAVPGLADAESSFIEQVDAGAKVSTDGQRIETVAGAIRTSSFYFVSAPRRSTTVVGRVTDGDGRTPIRGALVVSRGQTALSDGDGGFVLRQVLVGDNDRIAVDAGYLRPNGRVARGQVSNIPAAVNGITTLPAPVALTSEDGSRLPIVLAPSSLVISEGEERTVLLLAAHPDGGQIVSLTVAGATFATVSRAGTNLYNLRLAPRLGDRSDSYRLRLIATDDRSQTATSEIELAVNGRPIARQQTVSTPPDQARNFALTGDDPEGLALEYIIVAIPANGRLSCNGPNCSYTPNPGFVGSDQLIFKVNDALADSPDTTVTIFVTPPANRPPALTVPGAQTVAVGNPLNFTVTASDPDANQTLTFTALGRPINATFTPTGNTAAQFSWTPNAAQAGSYSVTFEVADNGNPPLKDTKGVTITVSGGGNRPPVANPQSVTTNEDTPVNITLTGSDPDGNALTYAIVANPTNGTLSGGGANLTYFPRQDFNGSDSFTFKVNDGALDSDTATVTITVNPVNDAPVLTVPGPQSVIAGQTLSFAVTASDVDAGQTLTLSASNLPNGATFTQTTATGGQFNWTPSTAQPGNYTVTFSVADNGSPSLSDSRSVAITVNAPANPVPSITSLSPSAAVAGGAAFTLTVNGTNFVGGSVVRWNGGNRTTSFIGGTLLTAQIPASDIAAAGTANVTVFSPAPGGGVSNSLFFTINPPACPTITINPSSLTNADVGRSYQVLLSQSGGSGAITWSVSFGALPANLTLNAATGVISGTPTAAGTAAFTIRAADANGCFGTRDYTLTINVSCSFTIQPTSQSFGASGGSGTVNVTTASGCTWTATSNASWLTVTGGASRSGSGSIVYDVAVNTGTSQRTGTMTIAGQTFTVNQNGVTQACTLPPAQMAAWWPGDGNANDIQGGNNGTLQNGVAFASGMVGQAFSFDGIDDEVQIPDAPSLKPAQVTIDAWVKFNDLRGSRIAS